MIKMKCGDPAGKTFGPHSIRCIKQVEDYVLPCRKHHAKGLFECRCETEFEALFGDIKSGDTTSCGCVNKKKSSQRLKAFHKTKAGKAARKKGADAHRLKWGEAALNHSVAKFKWAAASREIDVFLTDAQILELHNAPCCLACGKSRLEVGLPAGTQSCYGRPLVMSIDRLDSSLNYYSPINAIPLCWPCNKLKNSHSFMWLVTTLEEEKLKQRPESTFS